MDNLKQSLTHFLTNEYRPLAPEIISATLVVMGRYSDDVPIATSDEWEGALSALASDGMAIQSNMGFAINRSRLLATNKPETQGLLF